jgi:hypothetical protein
MFVGSSSPPCDAHVSSSEPSGKRGSIGREAFSASTSSAFNTLHLDKFNQSMRASSGSENVKATRFDTVGILYIMSKSKKTYDWDIYEL